MKALLKFSSFGLTMVAGVPLHAAVLADWTFSDRTTEATAMASENNAAGVTVSRLFINDSFDFAGINNVPGTANDGYGFANPANYLLLHRATYNDVGAPAGEWTSWGPFGNPNFTTGTGDTMSADGNAPLSFTVTAGLGQTVTVESLTFDRANGAGTIIQFQEAGATAGPAVTLNANSTFDVLLAAPVVIGSGETKSFTFNLNSGAFDSAVGLDDITLNGTVVPEPSVSALIGLASLALLRRRRRA